MIEVFQGDIRDPYEVKEAMKDCDFIFHLAALVAISLFAGAAKEKENEKKTSSFFLHDVEPV